MHLALEWPWHSAMPDGLVESKLNACTGQHAAPEETNQ
jgi:hypothetical protein